MKVRTGFVSNSSSSSFCIYGAQFSYDEINEILEEIGKNPKNKNGYEEDIGAWLEYEDPSVFPGLTIYHCYDSEQIYVGREWSYIGEEETGNQFKTNVENKLKESLEREVECETIDETIYN